MIIAAYSGVGKSTFAKQHSNYIDLESSIFHEGDNPEWERLYIKIAKYLSNQGYNVLVSTHNKVIQQLIANVPQDERLLIFPSITLSQEWKTKLFERALVTDLSKDKKALERALNYWYDDIDNLLQYSFEGFPHCIINSLDYDLGDYLNGF